MRAVIKPGDPRMSGIQNLTELRKQRDSLHEQILELETHHLKLVESLRSERDEISAANIVLCSAVGELYVFARSSLSTPAFQKVRSLYDLALRYTSGSIATKALASVIDRRRAQNEKWGEQNHDPVTWSAILTEECGEFAQAALETKLGGPNASKLRDEAVDCAAVALQIIEAIDRRGNAPIDAAVALKEAA